MRMRRWAGQCAKCPSSSTGWPPDELSHSTFSVFLKPWMEVVRPGGINRLLASRLRRASALEHTYNVRRAQRL